MRNSFCTRGHLPVLLCLLCLVAGDGLAASQKLNVVPKWGRFEQTFKSSLPYSNPIQEATLSVVLATIFQALLTGAIAEWGDLPGDLRLGDITSGTTKSSGKDLQAPKK